MSSKEYTSIDKRAFAKRFLVAFIPSVLVALGIIAVVYFVHRDSERTVLEAGEAHRVEVQRRHIIDRFRSVVTDLLFLSEQNEVKKFLESGGSGYRREIAREYLFFSQKKGIYDQIRLIDSAGMELGRVNYNNGDVSLVPDEGLQSKAGRYYFKETIGLGRGEVFVSPFDLNVEKGKIEEPLKPMIRFGTPVFDNEGRKRGVVVLNYLGRRLINTFKDAFTEGPGRFVLLNPDGFYLHGLRPGDEWGFMYEDGGERRFGVDYPEAWHEVSGTESGRFYSEGGLFTFTTVYPLKGTMGQVDFKGGGVESPYYWKVVSFMSADALAAEGGHGHWAVFSSLGIILLLGVGAGFFAGASVRRVAAERKLRAAKDGLEVKVAERTAALISLNKHLTAEVAERIRTEEVLRRSKESLDKAQRVARLGSWDWDIVKNELTWSDEVHRIFGLEPDEFDATYEAFLAFVHPDDREAVKKAVEGALGDSKPYSIEHRIVLPDGAERIVLEQAEVTLDGTGRPVRMVGTTHDITERRKMRDEALKSQKLESLGVLAGGIAHDFNNLLTSILGNLSFAKRTLSKGDNIYTRIDESEKASVRAAELVQQLLTFARGGEPVKKVVSIGKVVRESVSIVLRGSKVKEECVVPDDLAAVEADEGQISQVMNNILINAEQAMIEGGTVRVVCENLGAGEKRPLQLPDGDYIRITVADEGVGIGKDTLQKIFDPYFTTKRRGSGLGLASAYSIVKNHGGLITVESEWGVGATFHIYLPASDKEVPEEREVEEVPLEGAGRILIMDDEKTIGGFVCDLLEQSGYETDLAGCGDEAIEKYEKARSSGSPFSAVIMDLTIRGGMGGEEAIGKLREMDPDVRAIVSSGYSNSPVMADYKSYGFSGILKKPYKADDLMAAVREVIKA
ncbi:MAG: PAS domain-containing protein [Thermodesulfobacteriota bacterium]